MPAMPAIIAPNDPHLIHGRIVCSPRGGEPGATTGMLINNCPEVGPQRPESWLLEDEHRERGDKVPGRTRIWAGTYPLRKITDSPMARRYRDRLGHEFIVEIAEVPDFTHLRYHIGNDDEDTDGCPLIGATAKTSFDGFSLHGPRILDSRWAYDRVFRLVFRPLFAAHPEPRVRIMDEHEFLAFPRW